MSFIPTDSLSRRENWSEEQLIRLEYERRELQRSFAYHPYVRLVSMRGDPPCEYEIEFKVRTLAIAASGELEYAASASVHVTLPGDFPHAPPIVRPLAALFHPNVSAEGLHLSGWNPTLTLVTWARRIGELLAWRMYDPDALGDDVAMQWLSENASMLPLDATADFSPEAGGEPLERICRFGSATITQLRRQIEGVRSGVMEGGATLDQVEDFCRRARLALHLFLEADVPEHLRYEASQLDQWSLELPRLVPLWEYLRKQHAAVTAVQTGTVALSATRDPLQQQISALEALAPTKLPVDRETALAAIPPAKALVALRLKLPAVVREADALLKTLEERLRALDVPIPAAPSTESQPGLQLQTDLEGQTLATETSRLAAHQAIASIRPLLDRAHQEEHALRRLAGWREYLDLRETGAALDQKLARLGSAGISAYQIRASDQTFGPFQFEQPIDLAEAKIAVRSPAPHVIELIDANSNRQLARSETGTLTASLGSDQAAGRYSFQLLERWEDLAVQVDFLLRHTSEQIGQLTADAPACQSWCGPLLALLSRPDLAQGARDEHRKWAHRWKLALADLQRLGILKARMETANLIGRISQVAPTYLRRLNEQRQQLKKCTQELAWIVSRCQRDVDTDQLVIPPKLAAPYSEQTELRDRTQKEISRLERLVANIASQVRRRLSSRATFGSADARSFAVLAALPAELETAVAQMSDTELDQQIAALESTLNLPLRSQAWAAIFQTAQRPQSPFVDDASTSEGGQE